MPNIATERNQTVKFCKDCLHYRLNSTKVDNRVRQYDRCAHPKTAEIDLVRGNTIYPFCDHARSPNYSTRLPTGKDWCGPAGDLFETAEYTKTFP